MKLTSRFGQRWIMSLAKCSVQIQISRFSTLPSSGSLDTLVKKEVCCDGMLNLFWLLLNKWCCFEGLGNHWYNSTLQNWDRVHYYRPEFVEITSPPFWKFEGPECSSFSHLLALPGLSMISPRSLREVLFAQFQGFNVFSWETSSL